MLCRPTLKYGVYSVAPVKLKFRYSVVVVVWSPHRNVGPVIRWGSDGGAASPCPPKIAHAAPLVQTLFSLKR